MPVNSFDNYYMSWKPKRIYNKNALYISLAEQLEKDIEKGIILPGTKLPPQRELADYLDINVSTVSRAFKLCEKKGIIFGIVGRGTFVSYDVKSKLNLIPEEHSKKVIEMGSVMPETYPQTEVNEVLKNMINEQTSGDIFQYSYGKTSRWYSEAMIRFVKKCNYDASVENLLISNGGQNAIAAILMGVFKSGDKIGTDPLTYPGLKTLAKMLGIQLVPIKQLDGELSIEGLSYACKNDNIKAIYVIPDFQNPTAKVMNISRRKAIAEFAIKNNILIIEDSINTLLMKNIVSPIAHYAPNNTFYMASFSKSVLPSLRLACIISPAQFYENLKASLYNINLSQSNFTLELASRIIDSECLDKIITMRRKRTIKRNKLVNKLLKGYDIKGSEECIFRWLILPSKIESKIFEEIVFEKGVQIYSSERFSVGADKPIQAIRISITAPKDEEELINGIFIIKNTIENWE